MSPEEKEIWNRLQDQIRRAGEDVQSEHGKFFLTELRERADLFKVQDGQSLFYSGNEEALEFDLREGERPVVFDFSTSRGVRIDDTDGGRWLREKVRYVGNEEADKLWAVASSYFAEKAEGKVVAVCFGVRPSSIWSEVELPTLLLNQKVTHINGFVREYLVEEAARFGLERVQETLDDWKISLHEPPSVNREKEEAGIIADAVRYGRGEELYEVFNHAYIHQRNPGELWGSFANAFPEANLDAVQNHIRERLEALSREHPLEKIPDESDRKREAAARVWLRDEFVSEAVEIKREPDSHEKPLKEPWQTMQYLANDRGDDFIKLISQPPPGDEEVRQESARIISHALASGRPEAYEAIYNYAWLHNLPPGKMWGALMDERPAESFQDLKNHVRQELGRQEKEFPVASYDGPGGPARLAVAREWLRDEFAGDLTISPEREERRRRGEDSRLEMSPTPPQDTKKIKMHF